MTAAMRRVELDDGGREVLRVDGNEPTLVWLHEGLGSVSAWRGFPELVARRLGQRSIVYSRLGYGRSGPVHLPRPVRFLHDEAERGLPQLLDALGLHDVILIGHSDGASIALLYAAQRPARLRGVVAMAPHVFVEDVTVERIAAARAAYATTELRDKLARHHDDVDMAFRGWNDVWLDPEFRHWNIETELERIEVPVLLLQGRDDEYGTLAQIESIARRVRGPVTTQVLDGVGHAPHREAAEPTCDAIADFVTSIR